MRLPIPALTAIFSCGVAAGIYLRHHFVFTFFWCLIFLILGLISLKREAIFNVCVSLAVLALGGAALQLSVFLPKNHISNFAYYQNNKTYVVTGMVKGECAMDGAKTRFLFEAGSIEYEKYKYRCRGLILVTLDYPQGLTCGDEVILTGTLHRPYKPVNGFNHREQLARQGIYCLMSAKLVKLKRRRFSLGKAVFLLKDKIEKVISKNLSPEAAGVMLAMVLGEKKGISALVSTMMIKTGTVHILVVSGFNVGIVIFIVMLSLKILRVARKLRYFAAIFILVSYCLMTGSSNPVMRATIMGIFFLLGFLMDREPDIYNALSLAALFILIINPGQLLDIGFQLSFASVFSIIRIYPLLCAFFKAERLKAGPARFIVQGFLVSLSAWLGTAALIAYYFRIFCPVTVMANIFVVPLATLVTLCGFSLVSAGSVFPGLAPYLGASGEFAVALLLRFNAWAASLPGAYFYLGR